MKKAYPVVFTKSQDGYIAFIPDMEIDTQGDTLIDAIEMARDAIGIMGIDMGDENEPLPTPTAWHDVKREHENDIVSLVDVDFTEYRRKNDMRSVKRNCTVPSWLCFEAERAGLNFSAVLQKALKEALYIKN